MTSRDLRNWMWGEALSMLEQADRLHRQFCRPVGQQAAHCWEPPVDVVESGEELRVQVALPGVAAESITVGLETDSITISASRPFPGRGGQSIHRVEIPYGRFVRRIGMPMHALDLAAKRLEDGVLTLAFRRKDNPKEAQ